MIRPVENDLLYTNNLLLKKDWTFSSADLQSIPDIKILRGENVSGYFYPSGSLYYSPIKEPMNADGSYKRVIYNQDKVNFYQNPIYKFYYPEINLSLEDNITSIRIGKKYYRDRIIPNSLVIEDTPVGGYRLKLIDDGLGNVVTSEDSRIKDYSVNIPVNNPPFKKVSSISYYTPSGEALSERAALLMYKNGDVVIESASYVRVAGDTPRYDPINERYGYSLDSDDKYLLVSSISDENSFSLSKNGKVILNKLESDVQYTAAKIFQSPLQSALALESSYEDLFTNEYGDFILNLADGYLCASQSFYTDNFGYAVSINNGFCAITSPFTRRCMQLCETGSGLVYCYQNEKGGPDNWGIINVLEGERGEDHFGYSVSINKEIMAVGAPKYSGSLGAVYIFRKKQYDSDNPLLYTPTSSVGYDVLLTDVTGSLLSASLDTGYKNLKAQPFRRSFWTPLSQTCFDIISSNILEPIKSDMDFFEVPEIVVADGQSLEKHFNPFEPTPAYVKNDYVWELEVKLVGDEVGDEFGGSVSVGDDMLVIGNSNPSGSQLAWIYSCSSSIDNSGYPTFNWSKESVLSLSDGDSVNEIPPQFDLRSEHSGFGWSVAVNGEYIFVGAPYDRLVNGNFIGAGIVYRRFNDIDFCGNLTATLSPIKKISSYFSNTNSSLFGYACDISGKKLMVSSPTSTDQVNYIDYQNFKFSINNFSTEDSKSNDVFFYQLSGEDVTRNGEIKMSKPSGQASAFFGKSLSISGDNFFVGSPIFSAIGATNDQSVFLTQSLVSNVDNWIDSQCEGLSGSVSIYKINDDKSHVGNIFYESGHITLTNDHSIYQNILNPINSGDYKIKYASEESLFENELIIPVGVGEFGGSTNPSAIYGRKLMLDVNGDGKFDFDDVNLILKFINGESVSVSDSSPHIELNSQTSSWWKNDLLLTESEDAIIAEGLLDSLNLSSYTQAIVDKIRVDYANTGILDINGDGVVDTKDGRLLWAYWTGKLDIDVVDENISKNSSRDTLESILEYINIILGKCVPYPTIKNSDGGIFNIGNGGKVNPDILNYTQLSDSDPTGSYLSTYITSIGLYSGGDLIMVGKFGSPLKNIIEYPINLSIKFELFNH
jgi:hypothetical protein